MRERAWLGHAVKAGRAHIQTRLATAGPTPKLNMARPVLLASSLLLAHGVALAQSPAEAVQWAQYNRYVEVAAGVQQQDYREQDISGLTTDGVLDTETGRQSAFGAALRWQTDSGWLVQLQAQRQSGATDYSGYLQTGNGSLVPYQARSGNVAKQFRINLGYALNAITWPAMPERWQLTPLVQVGWHHWQRNLVQYGETYRYTSHAIGALLQWHPLPGTVLEVQALKGRTHEAQVSAPDLDFSARQGGGSLSEWHISLSQDLGIITGQPALTGWRATARYAAGQTDHGASPIANDLQAPPNQSRPGVWLLGLQKQF